MTPSWTLSRTRYFLPETRTLTPVTSRMSQPSSKNLVQQTTRFVCSRLLRRLLPPGPDVNDWNHRGRVHRAHLHHRLRLRHGLPRQTQVQPLTHAVRVEETGGADVPFACRKTTAVKLHREGSSTSDPAAGRLRSEGEAESADVSVPMMSPNHFIDAKVLKAPTGMFRLPKGFSYVLSLWFCTDNNSQHTHRCHVIIVRSKESSAGSSRREGPTSSSTLWARFDPAPTRGAGGFPSAAKGTRAVKLLR